MNEKIEGFFDACRMRGLTGRQGVIVPADNVPHLMLRDDVILAVERGSFHVYGVRSLEEAISLLTGLEAGARDAQGVHPQGTVHALAEQRLREFAQARQQFARQGLQARVTSKE